MPGTENVELALAQPSQGFEIPGEGPRVRSDENAALPEHGIARKADSVHDQGEVIGGMAGRLEYLERSDARTVAQQRVRSAASGSQRSREALAQPHRRFRMIGVIVGEEDPAEPTALLDRRRESLLMRDELRSRIHHPSGVPTHDPGVGARHRKRTRIVSAQAQYIPALESLSV